MATEKNAKEKLVTVTVPLYSANQATEYISVNDRDWMIMPGETVDIPECAADVLKTKMKAKADAFRRQAALQAQNK